MDITKSLDKGVEYSYIPMTRRNEHDEIAKRIIELMKNVSIKEAMWILESTMYDLFRHTRVELNEHHLPAQLKAGDHTPSH